MTYIWKYSSPLGVITLASDGDNITGLWFERQKHYLGDVKEYQEKHLTIFDKTIKWLDIYFKAENPNIKIPIKFNGTDFRCKVWNELTKIPYGKVISYGDIAKTLKTSARAVGNAVGYNPISIIVPCHRVIGSDGSLTGYAGGLNIKKELLKLEKVK